MNRIILAPLLLFASAFAILMHQATTWGYWIEWNQLYHHEVAAIALTSLALGTLIILLIYRCPILGVCRR